MFPIPWNFPFRKKDGSLGKIEDLHGENELPSYSSSDEGKVLGVDNEGALEWKDIPTELPEYSSSEDGKVLGVDNEGSLEWKEIPTELPSYSSSEDGKVLGVNSSGDLEWVNSSGGKIYYKEFSGISWANRCTLAKFTDGAADSSGIEIGASDVEVNVAGYRPISAMAVDYYGGYRYTVGLYQTTYYGTTRWRIGFCLGNHGIDSATVRVIVFYVKEEEVEQLT